jgi:hypothetical protein
MSDLAELTAAVRARRRQLDEQAGQARQTAAQGKAAQGEVIVLRVQVELHREVAALYTTIGEQAQETARGWVEAMTTQALRAIFGPQYSFALKPGERGGQATLELRIRKARPDGQVDEDGVTDAHGGGLAAVVGYVLRLVMLLLTPELRRILLLDEPFAQVSVFHEAAVAEFVREVSDRTGLQQLLVTHSPAYAGYADVQVHLTLGEDGMTEVRLGESE